MADVLNSLVLTMCFLGTMQTQPTAPQSPLMSEFELEKLRTVSSIRSKLRELIPAERHQQFDEELTKLGGG